MIFDPSTICHLAEKLDRCHTAPLSLSYGIWLLCLSSGRSTVSILTADPMMLAAGDLLLCTAQPTLSPSEVCHWVGLRLEGSLPASFCASLSTPLVQTAQHLPGIAELLAEFSAPSAEVSPAQCFGLLCQLARFDEQRNSMPPLILNAIAAIRTNYANFYGVEELAEHLGISKCHLVRSFKAATGTTPGQYLTAVRIEAAKQLLGTEDCSLDLVAQLSGFADANYFCKVFRAKTGFSPAVYRKSVQGNNTVLDLVSHSIYL